MRPTKNIAFYPGLALLLALILAACDEMDATYKEYIRNTIYTGKVDTIQVFPGFNRIKLAYSLAPDPKISRVKVYWNDRADSAEMVIQKVRDEEIYELVLEDMPERSYTFELFTFDADGNSSVKVTASGSSYGPDYQSTLTVNRPVEDAVLSEDGLLLNWSAAEENAASVKLTYTDHAGDLHTVLVPAADNQTFLENYKPGTLFEYRTGYLPEINTIDTVYTVDAVTTNGGIVDITRMYIKNHTQPFQYTDYDGSRWGTLKDWTVNAAARNQGPAGNKIYGGIDNLNNSASFALSRYNADPDIRNGKIYQTFTLPAGKYGFIWTTVGNSAGANIGPGARYIVAVAGDTLPDMADISTALSAESFSEENTVEALFTLEETTEISLGVLVDWAGSNNAFRAHQVHLKSYPPE